ncbi:xylulokinase [soil metagenome]
MAKMLGIDVGTSGCKGILIDENGRVLKTAGAEYPLSIPRPMWSEQNPEDWWRGVQEVIAAIGEPNPDAVGLTGQMHGSVFLDVQGEVVRPAILWNDQRTTEQCAEIDRRVGRERVREITRNPPLTGFTVPKILWLREHEPEAFARVRRVLLPKDYIRYRLTGTMATEVSDASGTGLLDVPARKWSQEMLSALSLEPALLPDVYESDVATAKTDGSGGLRAGIPVVGGGGDQAAGAVGTGTVVPGVVSVSLGTSGVVFSALEAPNYDPAGAVHTFCHANRSWHAMGVMLACGGAVGWFRDVFGTDYAAMNAEAASASSEGLTFLPYLTGERSPHNDPWAKGAFAGLTLGHGRAQMTRALFEGVTFGLLDGFEALARLGAVAEEIRVTGGGARSGLWLSLLADAFGKPVTTLEADEGPAMGAALLAGVGVGLWPDVATACGSTIRPASVTEPTGEDLSAAYARYRSAYLAIREWNRA